MTDFFTQVAKIYDDFLGYSGNYHNLVKTAVAPFGQLFGQTWATFYFNIWPHCSSSSLSIFFLDFIFEIIFGASKLVMEHFGRRR